MFGIGGSGSKSSSQSSSQEYGYSRSGSSSDSFSQGSSRSGSSGRSFTDVAFEDIFAELYGNASGAAARTAQMAPGFSEDARALFTGGLDFLGDLGAPDPYLEGRVSGESGVLEEQIGALGEDLGAFFRDELNPAITARAVSGGTLGGGRQGVAQGRAMSAVGEQFRRGVTDLRVGDQAQRDAAARDLMTNRTNAAGIGVNALPGLLEVARGGFGAELAPWEALSSILGGPTTLAGSEQSSFSTAEDVARAIAESFGLSEDFATSQSSSKSKSLSVKV